MSSFSINRVIIVGRLTRDPELRSLPSGTSVCSLRIACNSSRLEDNGERTERPNYFDVSVFGAAGESVARFLAKGRRVGIDGRLQWREWDTTEGQHRQAVSIVSDVVQFLDGPGGDRAMEEGEEQLSGGEDVAGGELVGVGTDELEVTF